MTRKQALVHAFRRADKRGLTENEMRRIAGKNWRRRLGELRDDGYVISERPSRFPRYGRRVTYRWVLLVEPSPAKPERAEVPMFDAPASPAESALTGDMRA